MRQAPTLILAGPNMIRLPVFSAYWISLALQVFELATHKGALGVVIPKQTIQFLISPHSNQDNHDNKISIKVCWELKMSDPGRSLSASYSVCLWGLCTNYQLSFFFIT